MRRNFVFIAVSEKNLGASWPCIVSTWVWETGITLTPRWFVGEYLSDIKSWGTLWVWPQASWLTQADRKVVPQMGKNFVSSGHIWVVFPRTGKMSKICPIFFSLELYCDQTVLFFQVFSIVLKRLCPLQSKNTFVLVPAIFFDFQKSYFLAQNLIFWQSLTLSCDQTVRAGLDLTFS